MELLCVVLFFVCTGGDVRFFGFRDFQGFLLSRAFHQAEGSVCAPEVTVLRGSAVAGVNLLQKLLWPRGIHGIHPIWFFP